MYNNVFITCNQYSYYRCKKYVIFNNPVNILLVRCLVKRDVGLPGILFEGSGVEWSFNNIEERDKEFEYIIENTKFKND